MVKIVTSISEHIELFSHEETCKLVPTAAASNRKFIFQLIIIVDNVSTGNTCILYKISQGFSPIMTVMGSIITLFLSCLKASFFL